MLFKFIGQYTNGRSTIVTCGTLFGGREPADVTDPDGIRRLTNHPEFEQVTKTVTPDLEAVMAEYGDSIPEAPKKRGRPKKELLQ